MGLPIYELTAMVIGLEGRDYQEAVQAKAQQYMQRLRHWGAHVDTLGWEWAPFLLKKG